MGLVHHILSFAKIVIVRQVFGPERHVKTLFPCIRHGRRAGWAPERLLHLHRREKRPYVKIWWPSHVHHQNSHCEASIWPRQTCQDSFSMYSSRLTRWWSSRKAASLASARKTALCKDMVTTSCPSPKWSLWGHYLAQTDIPRFDFHVFVTADVLVELPKGCFTCIGAKNGIMTVYGDHVMSYAKLVIARQVLCQWCPPRKVLGLAFAAETMVTAPCGSERVFPVDSGPDPRWFQVISCTIFRGWYDHKEPFFIERDCHQRVRREKLVRI